MIGNEVYVIMIFDEGLIDNVKVYADKEKADKEYLEICKELNLDPENAYECGGYEVKYWTSTIE